MYGVRQTKLVSVKLSQEVYDATLKYAKDQGIEKVSTVIRSLLVKKLLEDNYLKKEENERK